MIYGSLLSSPCCNVSATECPDPLGCPAGVCPDFTIKRHDTEPPFALSVSDCNGPLDLTDTVAEVSMWAKARLKLAITNSSTTISLADGIGFEQAMVGDVILVSRARSPEQMLIIGFDEVNKTITVQRGYGGTTAAAAIKGTAIRIFRFLNEVAETEMAAEDIEQLDGTTNVGVVTSSQILYHWRPENTCLAGCYWLEVKLLKIKQELLEAALIVDQVIVEVLGKGSITTTTPQDPRSAECTLGDEVEWIRRFPVDGDGYLIKVFDSPTSENLQA